MKAGKLAVAFTLVILLAGSASAHAFSFCFSAGGGNHNRSGFYNRPPQPVGFGPGIYQTYPESPLYAAPYPGRYYRPLPVMPEYRSVPPEKDGTR